MDHGTGRDALAAGQPQVCSEDGRPGSHLTALHPWLAARLASTPCTARRGPAKQQVGRAEAYDPAAQSYPAAECNPKQLHSMPLCLTLRRCGVWGGNCRRTLEATRRSTSVGFSPSHARLQAAGAKIIWMCWQMWQQRAVCCKPLMHLSCPAAVAAPDPQYAAPASLLQRTVPHRSPR